MHMGDAGGVGEGKGKKGRNKNRLKSLKSNCMMTRMRAQYIVGLSD